MSGVLIIGLQEHCIVAPRVMENCFAIDCMVYSWTVLHIDSVRSNSHNV